MNFPKRQFPYRAVILVMLVAVLVMGGCGGAPSASEAPMAAAGDPMAAPPSMPGAYSAVASADPKPAETQKEQADAEIKTWKRSQLVANTSRIMIGDREQLPLRGMQLKVTVDGFRARVVLDFLFLNDRPSTLEGTFQLRLPDDASPYFFAFGQNVLTVAGSEKPRLFVAQDVRKMGMSPSQLMTDRASHWSGVKEARMVPIEKAAFAYTETVHRRVDPALMEWSGAGVFSARVFPLAAQRLHRIVIGYDMDLVRVGDDYELRLDLPTNVPSSAIDLDVASPQGTTVKTTPDAKPFVGTGRAYYRFDDPKTGSIVMRLKPPSGTYLLGTDPTTSAYFAGSIRPDLSAKDASTGASQAVFAVDTSLSSSPDKFPVWLKLMQKILESNRDSLKKFAVLFFNIETSWYKPQFIDNTAANVQSLMAYANNLSLEGATDVAAAIGEAAKPAWLKADANRWDIFLLSDGSSTWGESDLYAMSKAIGPGTGRTLFAYQTGLSGTDVGALNHLARESGGAVFSVVGEAEVDKAATAHRSRPSYIGEIKISGVTDLIAAGRPKAIFPGQALILAGRGKPDANAEVSLVLERDGTRQVVKVPLTQAIPSDLTPRIYGQIATRQLEDFELAAQKDATAYAIHFRITGKTCSLLMLESEQDYARFGIVPQDNAALIQKRPASTIIEGVLTLASSLLGDPKAAFLGWVRKMREAPGITLALPEPFFQELTKLPVSAFRVDAPRFATKLREKKAVPVAVQGLLDSHQLDVGIFEEEAQRRLKAFGPADALRAVSSLIEEQPGDSVLARDVGFSAMEWGLQGQAFHLLRRVSLSRPNEPQTYRALAQSLIAMGKIDLAIAYYEVGLHGAWDSRFGSMNQITALDYLRLLRRIERGQVKTALANHARARLAELSQQFKFGNLDLVVMITWNTDNTDVDLHVVEPSGEVCYFAHRTTSNGGEITMDVTQGYGPEMYTLTGGQAGQYEIKAHYFASDRNRMSARTKVHATIIENWGTPTEKAVEKVVTLETGKQDHEIAVVTRGARPKAVAGPQPKVHQVAQ